MIKLFNQFWDKYFIAEEKFLSSIYLFRIVFFLLLCAESLSWLPFSDELFSNQGFHQGPLSAFAPTPILAKVLCLILIASLFLAMVGYKTNVCIVTSLTIWTFLFLLDHINEKALHGIAIVNMVIFLFARCGARFSVDDVLNVRRKLARETLGKPLITLRFLQLQFLQVYFFSGLIKISQDSWVSGETLEQILTSRWATEVGVYVSSIIPSPVFYFISIGIILYELFAWAGLLAARTRNYFIVFGIIFHATTIVCLYVGYLAWHYMFGLVILFYDINKLNDFLLRISKRFGYNI